MRSSQCLYDDAYRVPGYNSTMFRSVRTPTGERVVPFGDTDRG
jgi:hypothetical protein